MFKFKYLIVNFVDWHFDRPRVVEEFSPQRFLQLGQRSHEHDDLVVAVGGRVEMERSLHDQRGLHARRVANDVRHDRAEYVVAIAQDLGHVGRVAQVDLETQAQLAAVDLFPIEIEARFNIEIQYSSDHHDSNESKKREI